MSGLWFVVAAAFTFLAVTMESISLIVVAVLSLLTAITAMFAGQHAAVPTKPAGTRKSTSPGGKPRKRPVAAKPGTPVKGKRCGAACRRSRKPVDTCTCSCAGRSHGSEVGRTFESSRASVALKSKQNRQANRAAIKRERA